jgi:hypothetical protein
MMKWRKTLAWSGGAILLAALTGAVVLHTLVDPERLKEVAREKAQAAWSRDLTMGDVSLDLWPLPALHAESLALSNPPWAQEPHFLRADSLTARLELLALVTGKVRLKSLDLEGVTAELETLADGTSNVPAPSTPREPRGTTDLLALTGVRVKDADIYQRTKDAPPVLWHIDEATLDASEGLRDVRAQASVARNQFPLSVKARVADLSRFGNAGATSDGEIDLHWGRTRLTVAGRLPLDTALHGYAITADLQSDALGDVFDFFGWTHRPRAGARAHVELRDAQGVAQVPKLDVTLGKLRVTGDAKLSLRDPKKSFAVRLETDRLDWAQALIDAGGPDIAPLPPDEIFHDTPWAWPMLVALQGIQGAADVRVRTLLLRNGVELRNFRTPITFDGDRMNVGPFATEMLGGAATGTLLFTGRTQGVKAEFNGTHLLLERWFRERGSRIPLAGGAMKIAARITTTGDSMKALAAHVSGPITIRMGPAVWASKKAGDAEALMTNAFAAQDAGQIDFECVTAALAFRNGVAAGSPLIGFRTAASALITSGKVDLRTESLDVSGRVKPKSGVRLGLATIAGDVRIAGPLRHPKMTLDPASTPALIARAGAAIATLGLSAVGTALVDAAQAKKNDPCEAVAAPQRGEP